MNDIFREEIAERWVMIYMDNILVFSENVEEHKKHINQILGKIGKTQIIPQAREMLVWPDNDQIPRINHFAYFKKNG